MHKENINNEVEEIKNVEVVDEMVDNSAITIYNRGIETPAKTRKIARDSHSVLSRQSIEFINGKRKIRLSDISKPVRRKLFLRALIKCNGVIKDACEATGVARTTVYNWIEKYPDFAEALTMIEDSGIDFAESKLFENIDKGLEASIIFFLKTRGKKRGYQETGEGSNRSQLQKKIEESSDEELREQLRTLEEKISSANGGT